MRGSHKVLEPIGGQLAYDKVVPKNRCYPFVIRFSGFTPGVMRTSADNAEDFGLLSIPPVSQSPAWQGSPQSMSRLEWNKIAIWENKRRIKELQFFRDVYLLGFWGYTGMLISEATGKPFTPKSAAAKSIVDFPLLKKWSGLPAFLR